MENNIFRKKSMDRVSSPEQLNDYIRVSNPAVWMVIVGIIILLVGICVWGILGKIDTSIKTGGICEKGVIHCFVKESDVAKLKQDTTVTVKDKAYPIAGVSPNPIQADDKIDPYVLHLGNINEGEWVYEVVFKAPIADSVYEANITAESISPMSFILK